MNLYTIKDTASKRSIAPFVRENDDVAIRDFTKMVSGQPGPNNPFAETPEDFTLYKIGTWDDRSSAIRGIDPERLAEGEQLVTTDIRDVAIREFEKKLETTLEQWNERFVQLEESITFGNTAMSGIVAKTQELEATVLNGEKKHAD